MLYSDGHAQANTHYDARESQAHDGKQSIVLNQG
jgi:hypothetical protein